MIGAMARLARIAVAALGLVLVDRRPGGGRRGRAERLPLRGHRHRARRCDGVDAEIRGGDSFLELTVDEGHTVIVEGYEGEPYLRFQPDGTVERNRLSTATYLNDDRQGAGVTIPPEVTEADADTPNRSGRRSPTGGTYAWHDHRVHWMDGVLADVDRGEPVPGAYDPWRVPIVVDGAPAEMQGTLVYEESVSPAPLPGPRGHRRRPARLLRARSGLRLAAALLAVVSLAAVVVGWADFRPRPTAAATRCSGCSPAVALVTAIGAVLLARRSAGVVLALASVASLSGWALFRIEVLVQAGAAHRPPVRRLDRTTSPSPSASASAPPTSPSPAASSPSPTSTTTESGVGRLLAARLGHRDIGKHRPRVSRALRHGPFVHHRTATEGPSAARSGSWDAVDPEPVNVITHSSCRLDCTPLRASTSRTVGLQERVVLLNLASHGPEVF